MNKFRVRVLVACDSSSEYTVDIPSNTLVDCTGVYVQICDIYCTDVDEVATGEGGVPLLKRWLATDGSAQDGVISAEVLNGSAWMALSMVTINKAQVVEKW